MTSNWTALAIEVAINHGCKGIGLIWMGISSITIIQWRLPIEVVEGLTWKVFRGISQWEALTKLIGDVFWYGDFVSVKCHSYINWKPLCRH